MKELENTNQRESGLETGRQVDRCTVSSAEDLSTGWEK